MTAIAIKLSPELVVCTTHPPRRMLLDAARSIAAMAIVWLHTPRSAELISSTALGRFAVPFFTATAVFFVFQSLAKGRRCSMSEYARNRFVRLYVPFLAWTVIYLLFKLAKRTLAPNQPNDFPGIAAILTGGFYHLWFLPFVLAVTLATFAVGRQIINHVRLESLTAYAAAAIGTAIAVAPIPSSLANLGPCFEYGWMTLPAAFWAAALEIVYRRKASQSIECGWTTLACLGVTVIATIWTWHAGRSIVAENLAGLGFFIFALGTWNGPCVRLLARFGSLAYGIYLSHLLFIKTCEAITAKLHWPDTAAIDLATFAIAAVGSSALAWLLKRYRATRWLAA